MKAFRVSLKELIPLPILILTAYGGGLFFGQHPEALKHLTGGPPIILAMTGTLPTPALKWLQEKQSNPIEIRIIEKPSSLDLIDVDVLWFSSAEINDLKAKFIEPNEKIRQQIDLNLLRTTDQSLPVTWRIQAGPNGKPMLYRWMIADLSSEKGNQALIALFFDPEFQALLLSETKGFSSSLKELLSESDQEQLTQTPLHDLEF